MPSRIRLYLALGLISIFLSVWMGEPHRGYADISEYLDNAESLWLRTPGKDPSLGSERYPIGLVILSGPFVYAGAAAEHIFPGHSVRRSVIAFIVPVLSVLACLLLYEIGCLLGFSAHISLWAALIFGVGSTFLTFTRIYYTDVGTIFSIFLAFWSYLRSRLSAHRSAHWCFLSGLALSGVTLCHYGAFSASIALWIGFSLALLRSERRELSSWMTLCAGGVLGALTLLIWNYAHFGHPLKFGYFDAFAFKSAPLFSLRYIPENAQKMAAAAMRNIWLVPAIGFIFAERRRNSALYNSLMIALAIQCIVWLCCSQYRMFSCRYLLPIVATGAVGLLSMGAWFERISQTRGLFYSGLVLVLSNAVLFIRGDDVWPSFFIDTRRGNDVRCHLWYMSPFSPEELQQQFWGTRVGPLQLIVFSVFVVAGLIFLALAFQQARRQVSLESGR
jgi:hypothetical protein